MTRLVNDADLMRSYQDDPQATMSAYGVAGNGVDAKDNAFICVDNTFICVDNAFICVDDAFICVAE